LVYYAKNKDLSKTLRMDTSAFAEGLYFVKLNTSIGEITKKVIIE
jgi:hypothetical protein